MTIIFAYGSTSALIGATIVSYNVAWARTTFIKNSIYHPLIDDSMARDVVSKTLRLNFKLGKTILKDPSLRSWFKNFYDANYRWAVYGDFNDPANSGSSNLCQCEPPEDEKEVDISLERDNKGFILLSTKVF